MRRVHSGSVGSTGNAASPASGSNGRYHSPGRARIGSIEGDDIELENVEAEIVRGKYVRIGHGCRIGTVEYGENLEAEPGTVSRSTQTGAK